MTTEQKPQKLKKSETLEVRIPYETKQAFLTACREDGTTASEVVRDKVQSYLDERERPQTQPQEALIMKFPEPVRRYGPRIAASGIAAVALATFAALPSAAQQDFQAQFKRMDTNGDGVVTAEEYAAPHKTADVDDDDKNDNVIVETRIQRIGKGGPPPAASFIPADVKQDAFTFWLPEELGAGKAQTNNEYRFSTSTVVRTDKDGPAADGAPPVPPQPPQIFSYEDMRKSEFAGIDADKDGKVSFTEFQSRQTAMLTRGFEILDANSDKSLTQAEYNKIGQPPMPKLAGIDGTDRAQVVRVIGGPKFTEAQLKAAFTRLDANKDKKLSLKEYLPPA